MLQKTNLQYTRVIPGFFMDYWAMHPEKNIQTNLLPMTFGTDFANCEAAIPGDGNDKICMTYSEDMATFMARLLDVKDWPEFSIIVGDEYTYNELVNLGREARGIRTILLFTVTCANSDQARILRLCTTAPKQSGRGRSLCPKCRQDVRTRKMKSTRQPCWSAVSPFLGCSIYRRTTD